VNLRRGEGREAVGRDPQTVVADRQRREVVDAVAGGALRRSEARLRVLRRDSRPCDSGVRGIQNLSLKHAGRILFACPLTHQKKGEQAKCFHNLAL